MSEATHELFCQECPMEASSPTLQPQVEKGYVCPQCGQVFAWPNSRAYHLVQQHGPLTYNRTGSEFSRLSWENGIWWSEAWFVQETKPYLREPMDQWNVASLVGGILMRDDLHEWEGGLVAVPTFRGCY